ncbi:MAG: CopD family protein [Deltaproteobacteria bacterium]|nr:CopD family protein [Deltaproteobacteria bacterium]
MRQEFYLFSVWLHLIAAMVWIGGTIFLAAVLVPAIRRPEVGTMASLLIRLTAYRFRWIAWLCFAVFLLTGIFNLLYRGIGWQALAQLDFWSSSFGAVLAIKLSLVLGIVAISAVHDFFIGPRTLAAWQADAHGPETMRLRRKAVQFGRLNLILGLVASILGVMLVRGVPW